MNTSALILMIATQVVVTAFTVYFFMKVLNAPQAPEPDSYDEREEKPTS